MTDMIVANEPLDEKKITTARKIILELQRELPQYIERGSGPFLAAIYDDKGNLVAKEANSVINSCCSHNHAEMNTLRAAEEKLKTYDLSAHHLKMYVSAEPCMMCLGGIMWAGIKEVYFSVPSKDVEKITGFDEGFKPKWFEEFKKRGITVYGNIETEVGKKVLQDYVKLGRKVYKPER